MNIKSYVYNRANIRSTIVVDEHKIYVSNIFS